MSSFVRTVGAKLGMSFGARPQKSLQSLRGQIEANQRGRWIFETATFAKAAVTGVTLGYPSRHRPWEGSVTGSNRRRVR